MNDTQYDAIIVLGRSINPDSTIVDVDKTRLDKVAELYKGGASNSIIVCGSHGYKAVDTPDLTEAQAYAQYLEGLGVPRSAILLEPDSQETLGNLLFAKMNILMKQDWHRLLIIPTYNHSSERIDYLMTKIFGDKYTWDIVRVGQNDQQANSAREAKSLQQTKEINDQFADGDHVAIYQGLMDTHPAYGGTRWTIDELRHELGHQ
jgi:DUF218 domain